MDTARSEFSFWWQALGTLTGSLSLISLIQKLFDIGLAGIFASFVEGAGAGGGRRRTQQKQHV